MREIEIGPEQEPAEEQKHPDHDQDPRRAIDPYVRSNVGHNGNLRLAVPYASRK